MANGLTVKLDASGQMRVYNAASAPVRFLIDVVGYYSNSGKLFYPIVQARVSDSRPEVGGAGPIGFGPANQRLVDVSKVQRSGEVVVPDGASAIAYNLTVVNPGRPVTCGSTRPTRGWWTPRRSTGRPRLIRANGSVGGISPSRQVLVYNGRRRPTPWWTCWASTSSGSAGGGCGRTILAGMSVFELSPDMPVYVAGHGGLVGSAIWRRLQAEGFTNLIGWPSSEVDLTERDAAFDAVLSARPAVVVDAAARVGGSWPTPTRRWSSSTTTC